VIAELGIGYYRLVSCEWRGWGQLTGASISFHPSSPVLVEFLTAYFVPSGPTTSPVAASYVAVVVADVVVAAGGPAGE
jgi:hypothetical protein